MTRGAWRSRSFRLLVVGQGVSSVGDGVAPVALAFAILELTGSVRDLGVVLAAPRPRKTVILSSDVVRAGAQAASAALLLAGTAHVWELAGLQAIYGAARAFFGPASTAVVSGLVGARAFP